MNHMNVQQPCSTIIYSLNTNNIPSKEDEVAIKKTYEAALLLNSLYNK
ncbi:MAG: hypothetical protein ABF289_19285 [Clostridiales bacterium]